MKEQVTCGVVRDLLPLYADGVAGPDSRALVEEHLKGCGHCRGELEQLQKTVKVPPQAGTGSEIKHWKRALSRRTLRTAAFYVLVLLACLIPLILSFDILGVPAGRLEQDSGRDCPLLSKVVNEEMGLLLYDKGDGYAVFDIYVNRPGFDFGYHFRYSSSEPVRERVYAVSYENSTLVFSLTPNSGAARVELSAEPGTGAGSVYHVTPGDYFAVILPKISRAEDALLQVLDENGAEIPVHTLIL